jgi:glycosyl hydrolase family 79
MRGSTGARAEARRRRRLEAARYLGAATGLAILAALIVPLALPNRAGITRAVAGSHPGAAKTATSFNPGPARARSRGSMPGLAQATVTIARGASTIPVPRSYFGISTEYWALPLFERDTPVFERVLALLHVEGDGPLVVRIGGDSADHSFWKPRWKPMPGWAFALTPGYLSRLRALVERDHVKLIVDLNLVTDSPVTAAAWARAAETALPRHSIVGFEVGNEPDLYDRPYWVSMLARSPLRTSPLPLELTPATYVQDFADYARVLGESAPDIPLVGPAVAHPRVGLPFITALIGDQRSELGAVTAHLYPYSECIKSRRSPSYPTVARLLSRHAVAAFDTDIGDAVRVAHANGLEFRLTEFNSVTCGGKAGVSDTFATALWAPDALFTAMRTGVDGANLHVRASAINAPFAITRRGLEARPLLYGLLLFNRTLGPQARLVRLRLAAPRSLNLSAWAVQTRGRILHVLLIDKSSRTVRVDLHLPSSAPAGVQRLLAPSPYSRSGVTLNGQRLNSAGKWTGAQRSGTVTAGARGYSVIVPRRSAALLSVATGAPVSEHHRRVAVAQHAVLAVGLHRSRKH